MALSRTPGAKMTPVTPAMLNGFTGRVGDAWDAMKSAIFGPNTPVAPMEASQQEGPRQFGYIPGYNLTYTPRAAEGLTPFDWLIKVAELYDTARACVVFRVEEITAMDWDIVTLDEDDDDGASQAQLDEARAFIEHPAGDAIEWADWIAAAMEEVLVTDALSVRPRRTRGGRVLGFDLIDGATIRPLSDAAGRIPQYPTPAFQQVLYGTPWWEGTAVDPKTGKGDLIYRPKNRRTRSLYGRSPTEDLTLTINRALRRQSFDLRYYTDGNVPEALMGLPDMSPEQIETVQNWFDAIVNAPNRRRKIHFMPHKGTGSLPIHEFRQPILDPQVEEFLDRRTLARYGISPSEMGILSDVNRATADAQENVTFRRRLPYLRYFSSLMTLMLHLAGYPDVRFQFAAEIPEEDKAAQARVDDIYIRNGVISQDDVRVRMGKDPLGVANMIILPTGPVPLEREATPGSSMPAEPAEENADIAVEPGEGPVSTPSDSAPPPAAAASGNAAPEAAASNGVAGVQRVADELRAYRRWTKRSHARPFTFEATPLLVQRALDEGADARDALAMLERAVPDDDTVPAHRDRVTRAFATALVALVVAMREKRIGEAQFVQRYQALWRSSVDSVVRDVARATGVEPDALRAAAAGTELQRLEQQAQFSAGYLGAQLGVEHVEPTHAQLMARATWVAGSLWAAGHVLEVRGRALATPALERTVMVTWQSAGDRRVCEGCARLDGESWPADAVPQFPGDGGTPCGGMCRCGLEYSDAPGLLTNQEAFYE